MKKQRNWTAILILTVCVGLTGSSVFAEVMKAPYLIFEGVNTDPFKDPLT